MTCSNKRSYPNERAAERALGRARAKRQRVFDARAGSRRGLRLENRTYFHDDCGWWHLTATSQRERQSVAA